MMYTLKEEVHIIILLIIYGIYLANYIDILNIILSKIKNKVTKIIVEGILSFTQIYVAYIFMYKIADGYIPIYFLLFVILGIILYLIFRYQIINTVKVLVNLIFKTLKTTIREIKQVIYPYYLKEVIKTFKKRKAYKKVKDIISEKE